MADLSDRKWLHVIVSNHVPELEDIIHHLGLSPYIHEIINSALCGYEKPHPQIYRHALEQTGYPKCVWMIGDNIELDIVGPERMGINGILVRNDDPRAARRCSDLFSIQQFLE